MRREGNDGKRRDDCVKTSRRRVRRTRVGCTSTRPRTRPSSLSPESSSPRNTSIPTAVPTRMKTNPANWRSTNPRVTRKRTKAVRSLPRLRSRRNLPHPRSPLQTPLTAILTLRKGEKRGGDLRPNRKPKKLAILQILIHRLRRRNRKTTRSQIKRGF
ncbi:unnamed protein product [Oppiella nova]|uniref:Uncharacterized protein n=1 Tax=Oppiella nova TaxID=334625 RepID=A0A7R9M0Q1_9ACAR|nr:unnamed protein product [Oppiella nova]CAG2168213.1 unnamed protein product [Oppiella nova]